MTKLFADVLLCDCYSFDMRFHDDGGNDERGSL